MNYKKMCDLAAFIEKLDSSQTKMMAYVSPNHYTNKITKKTAQEAVNDCNTACCIAGWAVLKKALESDSDSNDYFLGSTVARNAQTYLELTDEERLSLFVPDGWPYSYVSRKDQQERMIGVLRGEIALTKDWLLNPQPRK